MHFSFCGTLLSQRMLEAWRHFIQPTLIRWLTSSSISPSFCSIDPKYRKVSFSGTACPSKLTSSSSCLVVLKLHLIYSVLVLLSLKPFDSRVRLHNSNFLLTPALLSSTSIKSSTKSIHHGMSPCICLLYTSD